MVAQGVNIALSGHTELSAVAFDSARELTAVVSVKAPLLDDKKRVPVDMILVVDRSGSMGNMMTLVVESIEFIAMNLSMDDRLSIIDYDNFVTTTLPLTRMDEGGKQRAISAAKTLAARGGTDLAGGLFEGLKTIQQRPVDKFYNEVASVLLFTRQHAHAHARARTPTHAHAHTRARTHTHTTRTHTHTHPHTHTHRRPSKPRHH